MSEWGGVNVLGKEERKWRNREQNELENCLDESWGYKWHNMVLVFKDQIGHFLKPLDVFGITPNLRAG